VFEEGSFRKRLPKKRLGIAISIGITLITQPPEKHLGVANSIGITMIALKKERSAKGRVRPPKWNGEISVRNYLNDTRDKVWVREV
jgi:hypothetical protein